MEIQDWNTLLSEEINENYQRKLFFGEKMTIARIEMKQGAMTQPHCHNSEEVIMVMEGKCRFTLPQGQVTLEKNQILRIPSDTEHSSEALEDTVLIDFCTPIRVDWLTGADIPLHQDPDQFLWAV